MIGFADLKHKRYIEGKRSVSFCCIIQRRTREGRKKYWKGSL